MNGNNIIDKARQFIGYGPSTFTNAYGCPSSWAWCVIFVWYIFRACGVPNLFYNGGKTAYVPTAQQWLVSHCTNVGKYNGQVGDVVIFTWGDNSRDHIGFIVSNRGGGVYTCIEGNTSGNQVAIRTRYVSNIYGIYRPNYSGASYKPTGSAPSGGYAVGRDYTLMDNMNVRTGPGTNYAIKKRSQLTADGKAHALGGTNAVLRAGTVVTCQAISGNWMKIPSGWVCCKQGSEVYISGSSGDSASAPAPVARDTGYKVGGTYTLQDHMKVRTGPGTNYAWKYRHQLTADGKKHAASGSMAVLLAGTNVTCLQVSGSWMRIPSGWVCMRQGNTTYIR